MKKIDLSKPLWFAVGYLLMTALTTRFDPINVIGTEKVNLKLLPEW